MNNAVLYLIYICLLVPNVFCTTAYSQSKPAEEGSRPDTTESIDAEAVAEEVPVAENETEPQSVDDSVDVGASSEEKSEGETIEALKAETGETIEGRIDRLESAPPTPTIPTTFPQTMSYKATPRATTTALSRPPSGTGFIVAGSIVLGHGGLFLLTAAGFYSLFNAIPDHDDDTDPSDDDYRDSDFNEIKDTVRDVFVFTFLSVGAAMVAVGLPLLIVGLNRRADVLEWRNKNSYFSGLDLQFGQHEVVTSWSATF